MTVTGAETGTGSGSEAETGREMGGPALETRQRSVVRVTATQLMGLALAGLILLSIGTALASRHIAGDEALRVAGVRSTGIARQIAAPLVDEALRRGDPEARRKVDRALRPRMRDGSVSHMLVWDENGRILWSDERSLVRTQAELSDEVRELFGSRGLLTLEPGQRVEHPGLAPNDEELVEVYVGALGADGRPFVFEAYVSPARIEADADDIFLDLLPVVLGGLLVFQLAMVPLTYSLARRVERSRHQQKALLSRSLSAWHQERRRIAQDLHDTVIQDLSSVSYVLPSIVAHLPGDASADQARATGEEVMSILQHDLVALRTMLIDLVPSDLQGDGLTRALEGLAARSGTRGVAIRVDVADGLEIQPAVGGLIYRVVREGLHNIGRHAKAQNAVIEVTGHGNQIEITITDDGQGLDSRAKPGPSPQFGLRLLRDLVHDIGGSLELRARDPRGTTLRVRVPASLPSAS